MLMMSDMFPSDFARHKLVAVAPHRAPSPVTTGFKKKMESARKPCHHVGYLALGALLPITM